MNLTKGIVIIVVRKKVIHPNKILLNDEIKRRDIFE